MESFLVRYRNLLVLLVLLVAQMLGLAMQVRRTEAGRNVYDMHDSSGVRLIRLWANAVVSPPEVLIHASRLGVGGIWQNYIALQNVRRENDDLKKTIDRLRLEQAELLEDAKQGQRLQSMLGFQEKYVYKTVPAQAIGTSGTDLSRVFYINKGSADGLSHDMAVMTPDGIVGKVREVYPHTAQVLAINDQTSGAGVILESTRIRGILRGNGFGQPQVVGILADRRIQPGEKVLTAGGDQIFPRGLPVGVVEKILRDPERDGFIDAIVKPSANLDRIDEVLVITSTAPRFPDEQQNDLATSEEVKGAEALAWNEKRKAAAIMAERLPGLTDPNQPAAQQPSPANPQPPPAPVHPAAPIHPDRFTPEVVQGNASGASAVGASKSSGANKPSEAGKPSGASKQTGVVRPSGVARPADQKPGDQKKEASSAVAVKPAVSGSTARPPAPKSATPKSTAPAGAAAKPESKSAAAKPASDEPRRNP